LAETNSPQTQPCPPSFETALEELELIVHQLEDGQLGLEQALGRYEHGVKLLKHCYGVLQRAERKIELLSGVDEQGVPIGQAFSDEATFDGASGSRAKPKRRASNAKIAPETASSPSSDESGCVDDSSRLF
jgi:exodeoxyribonuclease VII small subunit